jgi:Fe-S cluster biosynthesis and repair protein YggX
MYSEIFVAPWEEGHKEKASFVNNNRTVTLDRRHRDEARQAMLKTLKKKWDPTGVRLSSYELSHLTRKSHYAEIT